VIALAGTVECPLDVQTELGEGPVWDARAARLYFVDILRGLVHQYDPALGEARVYDVHTMVGAVAPTDSGHLVLAVRDGFARLDLDTGGVRPIAAVEPARPDVRMNDGKCDPAGRFWAGTMALDERPNAGALYRLDPDGGVHTMLRDVTISNGLDWSGDGRLMYFIDTPTQSVDVFDFDVATGTIANRRTMVHIPPDQGAPDGLTLDADDGIWVSLWAGGAVHRYAPDGTLDRVLRLPVTHSTSCAFGGGDLGDLYITTASVALTSDQRKAQPLAGRLLRCRPGPRGRAARRFAGL
jgi:sugar lactone lactonase YvrE